MRRPAAPIVRCAFVLSMIALFGAAPASHGAQDATPAAQDATPAAQDATPAASPVAADAAPAPGADDYEGIERIDLGQGDLSAVPGEGLRLSRITVEPGATTPPAPNQGNVASDASFVLSVESGTLTATFVGPAAAGGRMEVRRQAATNPAAGEISPEAEPMAPGDEVTLEAGDSIFVEDALYVFSNPGSEDAVALTSVMERTFVARGCPCIRLP